MMVLNLCFSRSDALRRDAAAGILSLFRRPQSEEAAGGLVTQL